METPCIPPITSAVSVSVKGPDGLTWYHQPISQMGTIRFGKLQELARVAQVANTSLERGRIYTYVSKVSVISISETG